MEIGSDLKKAITTNAFSYCFLGFIKERSIYDLVEIFETTQPYLAERNYEDQDIINILMKYDIIKYIRTKEKRRYFKTIFTYYLDLVKEFGDKEDKELQKIIPLIEKDKETWLKFWDSELFRDYLGDIELIRERWNLKTREKGYEKIVVAIPIQITLDFISSVVGLESTKEQIPPQQPLKEIASVILLPYTLDKYGKEFVILLPYTLDEYSKELLLRIINKYEEIQAFVNELNLRETELWKYQREFTIREMNKLWQNITHKFQRIIFK